MVSLQSIHRFRIASHLSSVTQVPHDPGLPISYAQLAHATGLESSLLKRLVRHAITQRVFCEPKKGFVAHTATSRLLAERNAESWMGVGCEEMWPPALKVGPPAPRENIDIGQ